MIWGEKIETGQQGYINKGENIQRWPREINVTKHPTSSNRMGHGGAQTVKLIVKKETLQIPCHGQEQKKHC